MSQNMGQQQGRDRDLNTPSFTNNQVPQAQGFEGMNYEQVREPYRPQNSGKNKPGGEQNSGTAANKN